ncbi:MAG TPA: AgmX/PglI C-terminal domain-containing protein [Polyangiaceae bacterium]|nr:AgmX/PglI C-terminal domain-containing protein [Polyangiaceae bacterium]
MTSTTPPPPKTGGSAPFIIAAIVMLLLMGGLIYWKTRGDDGPTSKVTQPAAPATTPAAPIFEEPPPPPPPPEEEPKDAGVDNKAPKRALGSGPGGCNGECKGEATSAMRSMLAAKAGQARGCYERALRQNSMLQGRLKIGVRISSTGSVCSANVVQNELGDAGIASCVAQIFRSSTFPAPTGGSCVDAEVPLRFEPKQ